MVQTFQWIDPTGQTTDLVVSWDLNGRWMPPVSFITDKLPGRNGDVLRHTRLEPRVVTLPVNVSATCTTGNPLADVQTSLSNLVYAMLPTRGDGKLRVTNANGQQFDLTCRYSGGLEMPEKFGQTSSRNYQKATLSFIANDPVWTSTSTTIIDYTSASAVPFFPFFPLHLSTSQIVVSTFVTNPGTMESWPIWTIYGPGSNILLVQQDTGEIMDFSNSGGLTIPLGESIIIDTTPGVKTVTLGSDGSNLWKYLTDNSSLWAIPAGGAQIQLQMAGTTPGNSVMRLSFVSRYVSI
jgi:phage-related protein